MKMTKRERRYHASKRRCIAIMQGEQMGLMGRPLFLQAQTGDYFPNVLKQAIKLLGASNYAHEPIVRVVFNGSEYDIWRDTAIKWVLRLRQLCRLPMYQDNRLDSFPMWLQSPSKEYRHD